MSSFKCRYSCFTSSTSYHLYPSPTSYVVSLSIYCLYLIYNLFGFFCNKG